MTTRDFYSGMGRAVAERTIIRKIPKLINFDLVTISNNDPVRGDVIGYCQRFAIPFSIDESNQADHFGWEWETWEEVGDRVAKGNVSLLEGCKDFKAFKQHLNNATILMSGRHLQHGDETQKDRNIEVFSNCSTAATSFILFYLLLNGSGVGRCYDDDLMVVNWDHSPNVRCVIRDDHPDFDFSAHESVRDARHKYGKGESVHWFKVPDTREGWAQAIEIYEVMTFQKAYRDHLLVLDFSDVREYGAPIMGMQGRPSSGPVPLMNAIHKIATLKGAGLPLWKQAMHVDHYAAEPILMGGARRAARIAVKIWTDRSIIDFIKIKRPIEYEGLNHRQIQKIREENQPFAFLWSSNNSVGVDADFWRRLTLAPDHAHYNSDLTRHARAVYKAVTECSYGDGTGEPGFVNLDKLIEKSDGEQKLVDGNFAGSSKYKVQDETTILLSAIARRALNKPYKQIVNPCGEISLVIYGAYCVIADVVSFHADTFEEAEEAYKLTARALIRVNQMDSFYPKELKRTNRIGVGNTGVQEFAWKFFKVGFRDLVNPDWKGYLQIANYEDSSLSYYDVARFLTYDDQYSSRIRAAAFWEVLGQFSRSTMRSAIEYSKELGVEIPHTITTEKPAGTTSKLFGLSEGWHLLPIAYYLRWVQFRDDDPLVEKYETAGYPIRRNLSSYRGHSIVGFPTTPIITELGIGDSLVLAGDASVEDQFKWLQLGEYFWLEGGQVNEYMTGKEPREGEPRYGNQISYTLKYKPQETSFRKFSEVIGRLQQTVRVCSVMPQADATAYEYLPEEPITKEEYDAYMSNIVQIQEDVDRVHVDCDSGACPINFLKE